MNKALVIESDPAFQEVIQLFFEKKEIIVISVFDQEHAIDLLSRPVDFDVIVVASRVGSDNINTLALIKYIRGIFKKKIIGASGRSDYREDMLLAGCDQAC